MQDASPPVSEPAAVEPRLWKNGTLVYTAGGLVSLFFWLLGETLPGA